MEIRAINYYIHTRSTAAFGQQGTKTKLLNMIKRRHTQKKEKGLKSLLCIIRFFRSVSMHADTTLSITTEHVAKQ